MPRAPQIPITLRKELTPQLRAQIIGAYRTGASMRNAAALLDVSFSNVQYTAKQESVRKNNTSLQRRKHRKSDGPFDGFLVHQALATPDQTIRELQATTAPHLGRTTIKQRLREHGVTKRIQTQRPLLLPHHRAARLRWALEHCNWTVEQWKDVLWSDECSVERGSGKRRAWVFKHKSEGFNPDLVKGVRKGKDIRVMVWAAFSGHLRSKVLVLPGDPLSARQGVTARVYLDMLKEELPSLRFDNDCVFMQDNAAIHKAHIVMNWLSENGFKLMDWPPYSPDLNPIEHVWFPLKEGVYMVCPDIESLSGGRAHVAQALGDACKMSWDTLKNELFENLVASMPDRVEAVIRAQGGYTKY